MLDKIIFQLVPNLLELFICLRTFIKLSLPLRSSILWVETPVHSISSYHWVLQIFDNPLVHFGFSPISSHPIRKAQPKVSSSAPADALSALSEAVLLHVPCQLYSCLYVLSWQLFLFFLFK